MLEGGGTSAAGQRDILNIGEVGRSEGGGVHTGRQRRGGGRVQHSEQGGRRCLVARSKSSWSGGGEDGCWGKGNGGGGEGKELLSRFSEPALSVQVVHGLLLSFGRVG